MADSFDISGEDDLSGDGEVRATEIESSEIKSEFITESSLLDEGGLDQFGEANQDIFAPVRALAKSDLTGASLIDKSQYAYNGSSVSEYYGRRLEASTSVYASLSKSRINERYQTVTKSMMPSGLVARPTDKDYLRVTNRLLSDPGTSMKGVYFQMQEKSVVSALMEARGSVDLLMDGVGLHDDATTIGVKGANEIVKEAFKAKEEKLAAESSTVRKTATTISMESGLLHPKMAYFIDKDDKITGFMFGTQNITAALPKNNTVEEAFFITGDKANTNIGRQIRAAVDVLHEQARALNEERLSPQSFRDSVKQGINSRIASERLRKNIFVNEEIHNKLSKRIAQSVASQEKVVLNIQYLENIFKPKFETDSTSSFKAFRHMMLESMATLAEQDRLTVVMSATSVNKDQGLFNLISRMEKVDKSTLTGTDLVAYKTFERLKSKGVFKLQPVQFMHSKTAAFLKEDNEGNYTVQDVFVTTANYGRNSFEKNVEVGLFLTKFDRDELGIGGDTKEEAALNRYFTKDLEAGINKGLFMEHAGKAEQVEKTIRMLERAGGREVDSEDAGKLYKDAKFTFSKRYIETTDSQTGRANGYRLVGLDIKMGDRQTFSVSIGSINRYTQHKETGEMVRQEMPVVYINKGNRIIAGAAYKYSGDKAITVTGFNEDGSDRVLRPGESLRLNATQVLVSLIETLDKAYSFEREKRSLLQALNYLSQKHTLIEGVKYVSLNADETRGLSEAAVIRKTTRKQSQVLAKLQQLIRDQDLAGVAANADNIKKILSKVPDAEAFYRRMVRENKSLILSQVLDPLPQAHELPYSSNQLIENLSLFGADTHNMQLLYNDYKEDGFNRVSGLILSQISLRHEDALTLDDRPAIRGVAAISRPQSLSELEMYGGLHKARESAPKVLNANILNSIQGLRAMTAGEYRTEFDVYFKDRKDKGEITDGEFNKLKEQYVNQMFRLYQERDLTNEEREDAQGVKNDAVLYFFPYPKTEQVSQRLKNLLSVRPLAYGSAEFKDYVTGFGGTSSYSELTSTKGVGALVRSGIISGLPAAQFAEFKTLLDEGGSYSSLDDEQKAARFESVLNKLRESSLNVDDPNQGFVGEEQRFLVSLGSSAQSDFTYVNAKVNRERGFIFGHRTQTPINFDRLQMSQSEFVSRVQDRLKPGVLFVAKDFLLGTHLDSATDGYRFGGKEFVGFIKSMISTQLEAGVELNSLKAGDINTKLGELKKDKSNQWASYVRAVDDGSGVKYYLKAGVYSPTGKFGDSSYNLNRIGQVKDGGSAFYIEDLQMSKQAYVSDKLQYMSIIAPAMARREENSISIITDISLGVVDGQPGMATLNIQFVNEMSIVGGLRGSNVKGPFSMMEEGFMTTVDDIYKASSGSTLKLQRKDLFGIIGAGQMKGFIFNAGNAMLRDRKESAVYKLVKGENGVNAGKRVAEALALIMLGGHEDVRKALIDYYNNIGEGSADKRQQVLSVLRMIEAGEEAQQATLSARGTDKKEDWEGEVFAKPKAALKGKGSQTISDAYKPDIAIYTGLLSLIKPEYLGDGAAEGLRKTVIDALKNNDDSLALQKAAQDLFDITFENYAQEVVVRDGQGGYKTQSIANETTSRSASLLAFFLKAGEDLLQDIAPVGRFDAKAITEFGYINFKNLIEDGKYSDIKTIIKGSLESFMAAHTVMAPGDDDSQIRATKAEQIAAFRAFNDKNTFTFAEFKAFRKELADIGFKKSITRTDGQTVDAPLLMSTVESFAVDRDVQHRYLAAAQAQGVSLVKPVINKGGETGKVDLDTYYANKAFDENEVDLALYAIYAAGQANRYMEIEVDPGSGRIMPAAGMQDQTELEGHYAAKLSKLQLDLYTSSVKDVNAYTNIQRTVLALGAIVENNFGYLGQGTSRSLYALQRLNVLELGFEDNNYKAAPHSSVQDPKAIKAEQDRIAAARLSLMFSAAHNKTLEKGLPRLLTNAEGKGIVSIDPVSQLVEDFFRVYSGEAKRETVENQVDYMKHLKQATSELEPGAENDVRVDYLIDNYISQLARRDETNPIRTQAEQLVSDLIRLNEMYEGMKGKTSIADDDKKVQLKQIVAGLTPESTATEKEEIKKKIEGVLAEDLKYKKGSDGVYVDSEGNKLSKDKMNELNDLVDKVIAYDSIEDDYNHIKALTSRDEVRSFLADKGAQERKRLLEYALAERYKPGKNSEDRPEEKAAKDIVTRAITEEIVKSIGEIAVQQLSSNTPAASAVSSEGAVSNAEIMFELVRSIIGKNFEDKIKSSISLDPGKEYLEGRQKLRSIAKNKQLVGEDKSFFQAVEKSVGLTQTVEIAMLETNDLKIGEDGNYNVKVKSAVNEVGIILGLDILERVALIFPEFSSEAINAQYAFVNALSQSLEEGILQKITGAARAGKSVKLSAGEIDVYNKLREAAIMSNKHAVELVNNQKTMRNAMGEQLNMVGASYIGVSSFLVNAKEVAAGTRFDNLLDIGNAGLKTLLSTLYGQVTNTSLNGDLRGIAAQQILSIQSGLTDMAPPNLTGKKALGEVSRRLSGINVGKAHEKMLEMFRQADHRLSTDIKELERKLYASYILTARQGAPAGSGADYAGGKNRTSINNVVFRAEDSYSGFRLDVEGNSTALILSTLGSQFTELGDYDGDSFQAAITRMAEISAEAKKSWDELNRITEIKNSLMEQIKAENLKGEEKKRAEELNEVIDTTGKSLQAQLEGAKAQAKAIAESLADKVMAMSELHKQSTEIGMKRIRKYAEQFLGLPAEIFDDSFVNAAGNKWVINAIEDNEIGFLFKQTRDTISGFYDNRGFNQGWLAEYITKVTSVTRQDDDSYDIKDLIEESKLNDYERNKVIEKRKLLSGYMQEYSRQVGTGDTDWKSTKFSQATGDLIELNEQDRYSLVAFAASLSQTEAGINTINKITEKALGSHLTPTTLKEVQAIIGSTGTGLLGQTYNTIIPLLAMTAGNVATTDVVNHKEGFLQKLLQQAALSIQTIEDVQTLEPIKRKNEVVALITELFPTQGQVGGTTFRDDFSPKQIEKNAALGTMLDIQQFLRDAALKPKEKASVGEAASLFKLKDSNNYEWAQGKVGLAALMDAAPKDLKGMVLKQFIKTSVGSQLNIDFGVPSNKREDVDKVMAQEMRAFSVLEMMNEYLSGKLTAAEMFTDQSAFGDLLSARRDMLRKEQPDITDREVVQDTLIQSLSRFRAEFIYNSVLEGKDYSDILGRFGQKIMAGYDVAVAEDDNVAYTAAPVISKQKNNYVEQVLYESPEIEKRVQAYKDSQMLAVSEAAQGQLLSAEEIEYVANKVKADLLTTKAIEKADSIKAINTYASQQRQVIDEEIKEFKNAAEERAEQTKVDNRLPDSPVAAAINKATQSAKSELIGLQSLLLEGIRNRSNAERPVLRSDVNPQPQRVDIPLATKEDVKSFFNVVGNLAMRLGAGATMELVTGKTKEQYKTEELNRIFEINNQGESYDEESTKSERKRLTESVDTKAENLYGSGVSQQLLVENILVKSNFITLDALNERARTVKNKIKTITVKEEKLSISSYIKHIESSRNISFSEAAVIADENINRLSRSYALADLVFEKIDTEFLQKRQDILVNRQRNDSITKFATNAYKALNEELDLKYKQVKLEYNNALTNADAAAQAKREELEAKNAAIRQTGGMITPAEVEERVEAFRRRQYEMQTVIIESLNKLNQTQILDAGERGKAIFKGIIFHNIQETMQSLTSGSYNMLDKLIEVNKTMSTIKKDAGLIGVEADTQKLEVINIAFASLMGGGKLSAGDVAQTSSLLTSIAQKISESSAMSQEDASALLMGAGLSIDSVDKKIREKARKRAAQDADGDAAKLRTLEEQYTKEMNADYVEILTTQVTVGEGADKRQSTIAQEIISEASRAAAARDMQREVSHLEGVAARAKAEGNEVMARAATNMAQNLSSGNYEDNFDFAYQSLIGLTKELDAQRNKENNIVMSRITEYNMKSGAKEHSRGTLLSLLAIPAIFAVAQGDVTFNDRVASMFTDVAQSLITSTSFEDSALRQALAGRDPENNLTTAAKKAERANQLMQRARVTESMRRSSSVTEGLIKGVAFEAGMQASGYISSKLSSKFFKGNLTAQVATEILSGMASMAVGSALTSRQVPGTFSNYDHQMALTMKIITNIKNNMLMVESQSLAAIARGDELAMGGESATIDQIASEGDFEAPEANTSMSYVERFKFYENTLESSEEIPIMEENAYV